MTEYMLVTINDPTLRLTIANTYDTIELVASESTFICWHWVNPSPADLSSLQGMTGYKGTVQLQ